LGIGILGGIFVILGGISLLFLVVGIKILRNLDVVYKPFKAK
jgi:hypothetical protein